MSEFIEAPQGEMSLLAMGSFLWRHVRIIGVCVLVCAFAAGVLGFLRTPKYRSEIVFAPANNSGNLGDLGGQLGGLAALAGVNIGGGGKRSDESLEYLRSGLFTRQFIERHGLMQILFARKWDAARGRWNTDVPPTIADGVKRFSTTVRQITEDRRTGMVTLAITWKDRELAAQWANQLVAEADDALRKRAIAEYGRSIDYLTSESVSTAAVEVRAAVFKAMESELKDAMIARTRDAYAFQVLDPAVARDPKDTDSPNKPLYVALGAIFGLVFGVILAATRRSKKSPV